MLYHHALHRLSKAGAGNIIHPVGARIAARTYEMLPLYCEVAVIYLMFSTVLTFVQRWGEKKLAMVLN